MLPDPANPYPDESPRTSVFKFGPFVTGLVSIAATFVLASFVSRKQNIADRSTSATAASVADETRSQVAAKDVEPPEKSNPAIPLTGASDPSTKSKPFLIDIKPSFIDYSTLVISVLSLIVTIVIAFFAYKINFNQANSLKAQSDAAEAQADAAKAQANAADDEVNIKFIEEFRERIDELSLPTDDPKQPDYDANLMRKSLAVIALAQYGDRALSALKMALEAKNPVLRNGAVQVLAQMLANRGDTSRPTVFTALLQYFDDGDVFMRVEVLRCFVKISGSLSADEVMRAKETFRKHIVPDADLSEKFDDEVLLNEAAMFFGNKPSCDAKLFLLAIAKNQSCEEETRKQARNSLRFSANEQCELPPEVKEQIDSILGIKR